MSSQESSKNKDTRTSEERILKAMSRGMGADKRFTSALFFPTKDETTSDTVISFLSTTTPKPNTPTNPATFPRPLSTTIFKYTVPEWFTNPMGSLHGGAVATIFDICTSLCFIPMYPPGSRAPMGGVTRSLNVTYLKPAPVGEKVLIICEVTAAGRQMACAKGTMIRERDGAILYTCVHDKVIVDTVRPTLSKI